MRRYQHSRVAVVEITDVSFCDGASLATGNSRKLDHKLLATLTIFFALAFADLTNIENARRNGEGAALVRYFPEIHPLYMTSITNLMYRHSILVDDTPLSISFSLLPS